MSSFHTLADVNDASQREPGRFTQTYAGGERSGLALDQPPPAGDRIELYADGFVLGNGPFRPFSDPANVKLWETIKAGNVPDELKARAVESPEGLVMSVIDKSSQTFQKPAAAPPPSPPRFQGAGYTTSASRTPHGVASVDPSRNTLRVDPSVPTVTLAFRFSNGTKLQQAFNVTHTTQDVYNYVQQVAPSSQPYQLVAGFPPQPITGRNLRELENDLITQRPRPLA